MAKIIPQRNNGFFKRFSFKGFPTEEGTLKRGRISLETADMYKKFKAKCKIVGRFYDVKFKNYLRR